MTMRIQLAVAAVLAGALFAPGAPAQQKVVQDPAKSKELNKQTYIQLLRADLRSNSETIIREGMALTDEQGAAFWPIYREYAAAQTKLGDEKLAMINDYVKNYMTMTNDLASQLAKRGMALDEQRMALRKKYFGMVSDKLGAVLALRFFQLEHQIQLLVDLQFASNLPIVEEAGK
jgi:hypothetical protein